ncbi:diguanylate cyclase [Shewanella intestini]|uniref:diguanylate cyclase n=1 Tax=Shewanella intestini TaxID=2017544 RepID=A0ABS5I2M3_9GAMM|nr:MULTISPECIES: diguanylate cyclase [Shewanella]MBR9728266.1 GGDEF domain-containing protein [Shewanella intestini]MRG35731.1 diguanylate cyclase [Shewanella sp. XMDDZSB0408]
MDQELEALEANLNVNLLETEKKIATLLISHKPFSAPQRAKLLMLSSLTYLYKGEFSKADQQLNSALMLQPPPKLLTQIYLYKITTSIGLENYQQAFLLLEKNLARIEAGDDNQLKVQSYTRLLNLYLDLEAYDELYSTTQKVLALNDGQDVKSECYARLYLGVANLKLVNLSAAYDSFSQSQQYCHQHQFPLIEALSIKGQANVLFEQGRYAAALTGFLDSLARYQVFDFKVEIHDNWAFLSEIYLKLGQLDEANHYAQLVYALPHVPMNNKPQKRANEVLSILASKKQDFQAAYQHQVVAHAISVKLINEQKIKQNAYHKAQFEIVEKTRELDKLVQDYALFSKQRKILNQEKSASYLFSTVLAGTAVFLSLLLVVAWLQRNKFKKQAHYDLLTGAYNRHTGQNMAEEHFIQCQAKDNHFTVLLFDLDSIKSINECFGHATGDWVLKKVAAILIGYCRPKDTFVRLSGEAFCLFLPDTNVHEGQALAENICKTVAEIKTKLTGHQFEINMLVGISEQLEHDLSLDPLITRADAALNQAKRRGDVQVVVYQDDFEARKHPRA